MERTVLSYSVANFVTINLMVLIMGVVLAFGVRALRGADNG